MFNRIQSDRITLHTVLSMMVSSKNHCNKFAIGNETHPIVRCFPKNVSLMIREKMFYIKPNLNDKDTNVPLHIVLPA